MQAVNPRRVLKARLRAGLSQGDLVHAIRSLGDFKTTERSVRNWETARPDGRCKHAPHADMVPAIAAATGVDVEYLYGGEDETSAEDDSEAALFRDLEQRLPSDLLARVRRAIDGTKVGASS